jgi:putative DNA primase/helicase
VNEGGYLKDSTGGRRFWPLDVGAPIDVARIRADRDQLWAEAAHLEAQGTSDVLPRDLWAVAGERQAEQTSGDPWADVLLAYLEGGGVACGFEAAGKSSAPLDRVHVSDLFQALGIATKDQTKDKSQRLRTTMESPPIGWHHRTAVRIGERNAAGYTRAAPKPR